MMSAPSFRAWLTPWLNALARPLLLVKLRMWSTRQARATSQVRSVLPSSMIRVSMMSHAFDVPGQVAQGFGQRAFFVQAGDLDDEFHGVGDAPRDGGAAAVADSNR